MVRFVLLLILKACPVPDALGQTTVFTYQGRLSDGGQPANGTFDLEFKLFDALNAGTQQGKNTTSGRLPKKSARLSRCWSRATVKA